MLSPRSLPNTEVRTAGSPDLQVFSGPDRSESSSKVNSLREKPGEKPGESPLMQEPLISHEALLEEVALKNAEFENADPLTIIRWAVDRFGEKLTFATAFGPEGMAILYFLSQLDTKVHCFNLDTGYQFAETLELREQVLQRYGIAVEMCQPELSVEEFEQQHGKLYLSDPNRCCYERKIKILHQVVAGKAGWISAIRRDQSPDRAKAPIVGWDEKFQLVKVNPLANWNKSNVWKTILDNDIPYNPLHDQGFPSIGCEPCTRPIQIGEDERAGRWSGNAKTECGLHSLD